MKQSDMPTIREANDPEAGLPAVMLKPGELIITREPTRISTILGSCVAICLYSAPRKIAAMCHCLLPCRGESPTAGDFRRFVDSSMAYLLHVLTDKYGVSPAEITVKLFGGANLLKERADIKKFGPTVGSRNILAAKKILSRYGLKIAAQQVGGHKSYKILFHSGTGKVRLQRRAAKMPRAA